MFTGLVEEMGHFVERRDHRYRFAARTVLEGVTIGDSIATNGCCLTVIAYGDDWWETDLSDETLSRTALGVLAPGDPLNFERAAKVGDRLGGHIVQGHVDGVGTIVVTPPDLRVAVPPTVLRYCVEKGSITIDGVSLTIVDVLDDGVTAAIIPHTAEVTTLGHKPVGAMVNLEVDVIAKYVERLLGGHLPA
ncbi:MAG: riboflavin synthase [Acidimicrobiia bacterium]|nr:riboflavin synthase [Acidimicrobiia bacterium]